MNTTTTALALLASPAAAETTLRIGHVAPSAVSATVRATLSHGISRGSWNT
jgi:hypothetical protein